MDHPYPIPQGPLTLTEELQARMNAAQRFRDVGFSELMRERIRASWIDPHMKRSLFSLDNDSDLSGL